MSTRRNPRPPNLHDAPGMTLMADWLPIETAPFDRDLQLGAIEKGEVYALIFPCRRTQAGWINSRTGKIVAVTPTHWREWSN